ncbi:hypothetical protein EDB85DRAFT_1900316 [Lactarius pseudohatsudake]|nr:hypothetical protein EDB85DRAFT_1900316 [Lactarius pseudohatsudake]
MQSFQPPSSCTLTPLSLSHLCAQYLRAQFRFKLDERLSELIGAATAPQVPLMLPVHLISELDRMALIRKKRIPKVLTNFQKMQVGSGGVLRPCRGGVRMGWQRQGLARCVGATWWGLASMSGWREDGLATAGSCAPSWGGVVGWGGVAGRRRILRTVLGRRGGESAGGVVLRAMLGRHGGGLAVVWGSVAAGRCVPCRDGVAAGWRWGLARGVGDGCGVFPTRQPVALRLGRNAFTHLPTPQIKPPLDTIFSTSRVVMYILSPFSFTSAYASAPRPATPDSPFQASHPSLMVTKMHWDELVFLTCHVTPTLRARPCRLTTPLQHGTQGTATTDLHVTPTRRAIPRHSSTLPQHGVQDPPLPTPPRHGAQDPAVLPRRLNTALKAPPPPAPTSPRHGPATVNTSTPLPHGTQDSPLPTPCHPEKARQTTSAATDNAGLWLKPPIPYRRLLRLAARKPVAAAFKLTATPPQYGTQDPAIVDSPHPSTWSARPPLLSRHPDVDARLQHRQPIATPPQLMKIEWDATHYVDKLPKKLARPGTAAAQTQEAIMRRQYPPRNDSAADIPISRPCIVVDMQGVILAWHLPGILTDSRQSEMMAATQKLHSLLEKCPRSTSWCLDPEYFPSGLEGLQGLVNFSPAWFQQGHELISVERVQEFPQVSVSLKMLAALEWLDRATESNSIMSAILAVIHPELYDAGRNTLKVLRGHSEIQPQEILHQWTSVYSGISVICNRLRPAHRDSYPYPTRTKPVPVTRGRVFLGFGCGFRRDTRYYGTVVVVVLRVTAAVASASPSPPP